MKLSIFLLLSLAALVSGDSSYSHYQQYQQHPNYYQQSAPSGSNYYQGQQYPQAQRRQSIIDYIRDVFFPNRRQGLAGLAGLGPIFAIFAVVVVVVVVVAVVGFISTSLNNSGRGLDTDEWEVDHSVWMDQLQKDFEDSWSQD